MFVIYGGLFLISAAQQVWSDPKHRMFPIHCPEDMGLLVQFLVGASAGTSSFITLHFISLYFQFVQKSSALLAGVRLLPFIGALAVFVLLNGHLMGKSGYTVPWYRAGLALVIAANAMHYNINLETSSGFIYGVEVMNGVGTGMFLNAPFPWLNGLCRRVRPPSRLDSLCVLERGEGLVIALAIGKTIFLNVAQNSISGFLLNLDRADIQGLISGSSSGPVVALTEVEQQMVLVANVQAIGRVFIMSIAPGCFCLALTPFMDCRNIKLG